MNIRDGKKVPRVIYREYTDSEGNMHTEYKDAQGNVYTEYTDANGNFHSDQKDLIENRLVDAHIEDTRVDNAVAQIDRADKNTSKGLLIGVIVTTVVALIAGVVYFLNDSNPEPVPVGVTPTERSNPDPEPTTIVEKEVIQVTPVEVPVVTNSEAPTQVPPEANNNNPPTTTTTNNNITVTPSESNQTPTETNNPPSTANPTQNNSRPELMGNNPVRAKSDGDLKNEIVRKFQSDLGNNQLKVEVNNSDVTISGNLETQEQMQRIQPLLKSIDGINKVNIVATIEPRATN
ncbi:MAG: BON domain-containing protein [Cyanobacterium sp.]